MSKRLDILGARIFGASVCHARKYFQPFRKCPNIWTKSPYLAIMHKHKPHIIRTKACICVFCYFVDFLHIFLDIFNLTAITPYSNACEMQFGNKSYCMIVADGSVVNQVLQLIKQRRQIP